MKKIFLIVGIIILVIVVAEIIMRQDNNQSANTNLVITNFIECADSGQPVAESYPRQCSYGGQTFTEDIGNELEKTDLIQVANPRPNQKISSPLIISGQARGYWYFEASFPVELFDSNNNLLANGIATAQTNWMTTDFVPFTVSLIFAPPATPTGLLILHKDNPSGLIENDDQLNIPVSF